jgi:hypothetical protein
MMRLPQSSSISPETISLVCSNPRHVASLLRPDATLVDLPFRRESGRA